MRRAAAALLCSILVSLSATASANPADVASARTYRQSHEKGIIAEFSDLLSLPNVATSEPAIEANASFIREALARRGFTTDLLRGSPGTPPAIFAELKAPGATRTILFYAHYDGQPVAQDGWRSPPFTPVVRAGSDASTSAEVDWRTAARLDPEWRIYARSASDDKVPIQAMLTALDALRSAGRRPQVNIKLFYEGEEEQRSPHLAAILAANAERLKADLFLLSDGPRYPTGDPELFFGARGTSSVELTVYGPARPLHSGHYGNWAPNPAAMLSRLLASLRDDDGTILIPGFYADVRALSPSERDSIAGLPDVENRLKAELALGRTEAKDGLWVSLARPALNIRGIRAGAVGDDASNTIATEARASIDFRLVPDETPGSVRDLTEQFLAASGWHVVHDEPSLAERASFPRVVRLDWTMGYPAYRTDLDSFEASRISRAILAAVGHGPVKVPMLGASVPMTLFASALHVPVIGLPLANYDNNQHGANENLRLKNLWDAIDITAAILTERQAR